MRMCKTAPVGFNQLEALTQIRIRNQNKKSFTYPRRNSVCNGAPVNLAKIEYMQTVQIGAATKTKHVYKVEKKNWSRFFRLHFYYS